MQPFTKVTAVAAPYPHPNVDTDQIIPARFLRQPKDERYGTYLFHDLRLESDGKTERPDFVLNRPPFRNAQILVADRAFGVGSSREGAVYALMAGGFRAVIASSFGDIFFGNSLKNGFVPVRLDQALVETIRGQVEAAPGAEITVDLERQVVVAPDGREHPFAIPPFQRQCILRGLDDIQFTLENQPVIEAFERRFAAAHPWL
jgi:3-isopropylmalate/(R)-2-methylmalate dehydratase small subunit